MSLASVDRGCPPNPLTASSRSRRLLGRKSAATAAPAGSRNPLGRSPCCFAAWPLAHSRGNRWCSRPRRSAARAPVLDAQADLDGQFAHGNVTSTKSPILIPLTSASTTGFPAALPPGVFEQVHVHLEPRELFHRVDVLDAAPCSPCFPHRACRALSAERGLVEIPVAGVGWEVAESLYCQQGRKVLKFRLVPFSDRRSLVCSASILAIRCSRSVALGGDDLIDDFQFAAFSCGYRS